MSGAGRLLLRGFNVCRTLTLPLVLHVLGVDGERACEAGVTAPTSPLAFVLRKPALALVHDGLFQNAKHPGDVSHRLLGAVSDEGIDAWVALVRCAGTRVRVIFVSLLVLVAYSAHIAGRAARVREM